MKLEQDSIFTSSIRAFCIAFFAMLGLWVALIPLSFFLGSMFGSGKDELEIPGGYTVMPNERDLVGTVHASTPLFLQIDIDGVIGTEVLNSSEILDQLKRSREGSLKESPIKGLLLHINSPGGTVFDGNGIYRLVLQYKEKFHMPVYAYVDGLCASGGMYIASAADKIYASSDSLIGSVGTIMNLFNYSEGMGKIGVQSLTLTEGIDKDEMNPFRPWRPGEDKAFQDILFYYYNQFLDVVLKARPMMTRDLLVNEYGARVFPAPDAQMKGYIDGVIDDQTIVLAMLAKEAGVSAEENYQLIRLEKKSWIEILFKNASPLLPDKIEHQITLPKNLEARTMNGLLYLYQPELSAQ